MTVAAETRAAVRSRPYLETALRAGIVNYTAAARLLDCGDEAAVAAALRRYADELESHEPANRRVTVSMQSGLERADSGGLLRIGDIGYEVADGDLTAVVARGDVDALGLEPAVGRLRTADVDVDAAAATDGSLVVVVPRRGGADAVRAIEDAL